MLVGELSGVKAGDYVIDVCAAPGGKALHAAEKLLLAGSGHVEARDLTERKVELIRANIERMGLENVSAVCMDASVPDEASAGKADVVIADLPCSGLGVLGKKPDLRYRADPAEKASEQKQAFFPFCRYRIYCSGKLPVAFQLSLGERYPDKSLFLD